MANKKTYQHNLSELDKAKKLLAEQEKLLSIEKSLEKVRSSALSMSSSKDLSQTIGILFEELESLGLKTIRCGIGIFDDDSRKVNVWSASEGKGNKVANLSGDEYLEGHPLLESIYKNWKLQKDLSYTLESEDLHNYYKHVSKTNHPVSPPKNIKRNQTQYYHAVMFPAGGLFAFKETPFDNESISLMKRFTNVFHFAFIRHRDLVKAEAQKRQAMVEASLERIRGQSMAMQNTSDLLDIVVTLRNEFINLGHEAHYFWHMLWLEDIYEKAMTSGDGTKIGFVMELPRHIHGNIPQIANWEKSDSATMVYAMNVDEAIDYVDKMVELGNFKNIDPQAPTHDDIRHIGGLTFIMAKTTYGEIGYSLPGVVNDPPKEDIELLTTFANVFDLAHKRFEDLRIKEKQKREAEIELALERVRSRTMAMKESDELPEAANLLFLEIQALGIPTWSCGYNILSEDFTYTTCIMSSEGELQTPFKLPLTEHYSLKYWHDALTSGQEFFVNHQEGKELVEHYEYMKTLPDLKGTFEQFEEAGLDLPTIQYNHLIRFSQGFLLFITYEEVPEAYDIFRRFGKVFDQTYTRFLDLKKAEEQARTAEINLAVERVRAKAMAMHKSEEIIDLVAKLKYEIMSLDIPDIVAATILLNEANDQVRMWDLSSLELDDELNEVPFDITFKLKQNDPDLYMKKVWENKEDYFVVIQEEKGFNRLMEWLREHGKSEVAEEVEDFMEKTQLKRLYHTAKKLNYGKLIIDLLNPPSDEMKTILTKMGDAFDLAYTRFLDLKNAEAQTRKAQIETSLERVRSRSLAMNDSDELNDVLSVLFKQFDVLEIRPVTAFLSLLDIKNNTFTYRSTGKAGTRMQTQQVVDLNSLDVWKDLVKKWQNDTVDSIEEIHYPKELLPDLFDLFEETFSAMPKEERVTAEDFPDGGYAVHGYCKFGYLGFNHTRKATEEEKEILRLFSNEFSRVYQRFLDIKKAEAQAREAQIEAALERVRSRSMSMQKSNELLDVATILFEELSKLEVFVTNRGAATISILTSDPNRMNSFVCGSSDHGLVTENFVLKRSDNKIIHDLFNCQNLNSDVFIGTYNKSQKNSFYQLLFDNSELKIIPEEIKTEILNAESLTLNVISNEYFTMNIIDLEQNPLKDSEIDILRRFSEVFKQSYTRFLDLKKAEKQAREAQIETALERVRSRTMGMQHSDELKETATLMFDQIKSLDVDVMACGFNIWNEDKSKATAWMAGMNRIQPPFQTDSSKDIFKRIYQAAKDGKDFFVEEQSGKKLEAHYKYMASIPTFKKILKQLEMEGGSVPELQIVHCAYFNYGYLMFITLEKVLEAHNIFKRFGKVFEQTYTRFLDLQKAEEQAREAQIEAALERVRSRSMAMQRSDELLDIILVISQQLQQLNIDYSNVSFGINNEKYDMNLWMAIKNHDKAYDISWTYIDNPGITRYRKAKDTPGTVFSDILTQAENNEWIRHIVKCNPELDIFSKEEQEKLYNTNGYARSIVYLKDICLVMGNYIPKPFTEEENTILRRFAMVFEQSYTRFQDLKKAEEQAREAQIEAALERVRSRTMGMQKSEELSEVAKVLFEQFSTLGRLPDRMSIGIIDEEIGSIKWWVTDQSGIGLKHSFTSPFEENKTIDSLYSAWKKGEKSISIELKGKDLKNWLDFVTKEVKLKIDDSQIKGKRVQQAAFFSKGLLIISTHEAVAPEIIEILKRFAKVFNQTYTRFLDLQRAEEQAKEAKIEAALERVRATAMAMHNTDDLLNVIKVIFDQLLELNITMNNVSFGSNIQEEKSNFWLAARGLDHPIYMSVPYIDNPAPNRVRQAQKDKVDFFADRLTVEENKTWLHHVFKHTDVNLLSEEDKEIITNSTFTRSNFILNNINLYVGNYFGWTYTDEENGILRRFAKAFEQAYTRFLDLQKAEEQAREAQIEAALERVRSRSIGMQSSDELSDLSLELVKQVQNLGVSTWFCAFNIYSKDGKTSQEWGSNGEGVFPRYSTPREGVFLKYYQAGQQGQDLLVNEIDEEECPAHYDYLCSLPGVGDQLLKMKEEGIPFPTYQIDHVAFFKYGYIIYITYEPVPESHDVFKRFAKVFEQTYTRFLDLQKAEVQAREAKIEAALERIRSRSMAMQNSKDLHSVVTLIYEQLESMGLVMNSVLLYELVYEDNKNLYFWVAANGQVYPEQTILPINRLVYFTRFKKARDNKESFFTQVFNKKQKDTFFKHYFENSNHQEIPQERKDFINSSLGLNSSTALNTYTALSVLRYGVTPFTQEQNDVIERFAKVFEQSYQRFLDLKKAEAQAREAQIEAALERVRSRSMAMHKSEELLDVISVVSEQLQQLGFKFNHVSFAINSLDEKYNFWVSAKDSSKPMLLKVPIADLAVFNSIRTALKQSASFLTDVISRIENKNWHKHLLKHVGSGVFSKETNEYIMSRGMARSIAINPNVMLILANYASTPYSEDQNKIIARFGRVFEQSYTRFLDLQKAEEQARESQIEASLEKVRSRTLAMENSSEFAETSVVVFEQMLELGISPNRLFIGIIEDDGNYIDAWATNEDGSKLANQFRLEPSRSKSITKMIDGLKDGKKSIIIDMKGKELQEYYDYLSGELNIPFQKGLNENRRVQYISYFSGGILGLAASEEQGDETMELLERFAAVFNLTYTRFKDLKIAEAQALKAEQDLIEIKAARKKAEKALKELQSTQKQLIQSEKMASLGELTAGIAHEIQNPLNFVNNFSEVSTELLDEIEEELQKGDITEVRAILTDIKENLLKINHHGKRADGIVKGMLLHSRESSSEKESIDLNQLVDEYLRLAYHGFRAKDKSFNSELITDYQEDLKKINIVQQDIGRVVLNIITNSFHTVTEKKESLIDDSLTNYNPTVSVKTYEKKNSIFIEITDNGKGIPDSIIDKIFQPFFTTKPTGQGTGLGLSIGYDIIKAHGGDMQVETIENEGTTFIINLPY